MPSYYRSSWFYSPWEPPESTTNAALGLHRRGVPFPAVAPMLTLLDDRSELEVVAPDWSDRSWWVSSVYFLTGATAHECARCDLWVWNGDAHTVEGDCLVCERCRDVYYFYCASCEEYENRDYSSYVGGLGSVCEGCLEGMPWCDYCEEYSYYEHDHEEESGACSGGKCVAPLPTFSLFGHANDELFSVDVAGGLVDGVGLNLIRDTLHASGIYWADACAAVDSVGNENRTSHGTFSKRVARAVWKRCAVKLSPDVLTRIGNYASEYASKSTTRLVAFTRDLNQSPYQYANGGSCWWGTGEYAVSRCAFKSWGGIALRLFDPTDPDTVVGRALIMPLGEDGQPTHHEGRATSFAVFNAYGEGFSGYDAARMVAGLAGMSYKKVPMSIDNVSGFYVNGDVAFLVASEPVADRVRLTCEDPHDTRDASALVGASI